jgi:hypothetical protein
LNLIGSNNNLPENGVNVLQGVAREKLKEIASIKKDLSKICHQEKVSMLAGFSVCVGSILLGVCSIPFTLLLPPPFSLIALGGLGIAMGGVVVGVRLICNPKWQINKKDAEKRLKSTEKDYQICINKIKNLVDGLKSSTSQIDSDFSGSQNA